MDTLRWFIGICLSGLAVLNVNGQTVKLDPGNKKYYLEAEGSNITKSIYDTLIKPYDSWHTVITKTRDGYGLLFVGGKKPIELLPNEYEHIQHMYFQAYFVKKNGKYALYEAMDNLDMDDNDKPFFLSKTPIFGTDFLYDKTKFITLKARLYNTYGDEWKTWYYGAVWQGDRVALNDYSRKDFKPGNPAFSCDDLELINIDTKPFFKIRTGNLYGIVDEAYNVKLPVEYDSITHLRTMIKLSGYKDRKISNDFLILHKTGKMYLASVTPGSSLINQNFEIEAYHIEDETLFFTEKGKSMKMEEGQKIAADFEIAYADKYDVRIIKKNDRYGLRVGERIVLEPVYADYNLATSCGIDEYVYFFRKERGDHYTIFSARDKKFILKTEKISDMTCNSNRLYVKREDAKWYSLVGENFSYPGKPVIGYDSLGTVLFPSRDILGYRNGKIYQITNVGDYKEVWLPAGVKNVTHVPETNGFVYKVNGKFGYNDQTTTFPPSLDNLNMGYDKKKGVNFFSTFVDGQEYLFYAEDFGKDQSIRSFVDCQVCYGYGFQLGSESKTTVVEGQTTTRSERVFLWRDGEYERTTTTVEPDREVTTTTTIHKPCPACSGTGKKGVRLRSSAGQMVVD